MKYTFHILLKCLTRPKIISRSYHIMQKHYIFSMLGSWDSSWDVWFRSWVWSCIAVESVAMWTPLGLRLPWQQTYWSLPDTCFDNFVHVYDKLPDNSVCVSVVWKLNVKMWQLSKQVSVSTISTLTASRHLPKKICSYFICTQQTSVFHAFFWPVLPP